jgi:hypothetical protein
MTLAAALTSPSGFGYLLTQHAPIAPMGAVANIDSTFRRVKVMALLSGVFKL